MDSKSIRYNNVRILVREAGGISNFANKINKGQSQVSQFAGANPIKGIGSKVAREIEVAFDKPHGWLDAVYIDSTYIEAATIKPMSIPDQSRINKNIDYQALIDELTKLDEEGKLTPELTRALIAVARAAS